MLSLNRGSFRPPWCNRFEAVLFPAVEGTHYVQGKVGAEVQGTSMHRSHRVAMVGNQQ